MCRAPLPQGPCCPKVPAGGGWESGDHTWRGTAELPGEAWRFAMLAPLGSSDRSPCLALHIKGTHSGIFWLCTSSLWGCGDQCPALDPTLGVGDLSAPTQLPQTFLEG